MRSRWAILTAALLFTFMSFPHAIAAPGHMTVAQADQNDAETQGEDAGTADESGQSDSKAETGSDEGGTEAAEPETGPPWTYQMARIIVVLSILLGLAILRWYWKLVGSRQKTA